MGVKTVFASFLPGKMRSFLSQLDISISYFFFYSKRFEVIYPNRKGLMSKYSILVTYAVLPMTADKEITND